MTDERPRTETIEEMEADLVAIYRWLHDNWGGWHAPLRAPLERASMRLAHDVAKLRRQETLLIEGRSFEELFGPAAIDMATIERVAAAALDVLITPKPDFEEPTTEDCEAYSQALFEFCHVCDEKTILALAYLARGVLLSEVDVREVVRRPTYFLLPDGTPVRISSISDLALVVLQDKKNPVPAPATTIAEARRMVHDAIRIERDSHELMRRAQRALDDANETVEKLRAQLEEQKKSLAEMGDRLASGTARGGRG